MFAQRSNTHSRDFSRIFKKSYLVLNLQLHELIVRPDAVGARREASRVPTAEAAAEARSAVVIVAMRLQWRQLN